MTASDMLSMLGNRNMLLDDKILLLVKNNVVSSSTLCFLTEKTRPQVYKRLKHLAKRQEIYKVTKKAVDFWKIKEVIK